MNPYLLIPLSVSLLASAAIAQEIEPSGTFGLEVFAVTEPAGASKLMFSSRVGSALRLADLPAPPSRWLHRRRHMAASEAPVLKDLSPSGLVLFVPLGDSAGTGGLTVLDFRAALLQTDVSLNGPPAYDPILLPARGYAICASDDGQDGTVLEVVSYAQPGQSARLIGSLTVSGAPAGGVTRMHATGSLLFVPTTRGVHVLGVGAAPTPLSAVAHVDSGTRSPVTNLAAFTRGSDPHFAILVSNFGANGRPSDAAIVSFDRQGGQTVTTDVGDVPNTSPPKPYVPAAGCHDPGVVERGGTAYVAFLLREKEPGTFFTKPAGVAVAGFGMPNDPTFAVVRTLALSGEPFAELSVHGTRMSFMTSESPDWWPNPPGGSERLNILYTPLDPVGSGTVGGVIGTAGPLGGRIGVEVTDRALWSRDGATLFVTTVNYPGAPNPGISGSEILRVPADRAINPLTDPMETVLPLRDQTNERAYGLPTAFAPPPELPADAFGDFTLFGQMTNTAAHGVLVPHSVRGYLATDTPTPRALPRNTNIPGFPSIPPRTFDDVNGSIVAPPQTFGARRAGFNLLDRVPTILAAYLVQADGDELFYQATGFNTVVFQNVFPVVTVSLPAGCVTATEILSF